MKYFYPQFTDNFDNSKFTYIVIRNKEIKVKLKDSSL